MLTDGNPKNILHFQTSVDPTLDFVIPFTAAWLFELHEEYIERLSQEKSYLLPNFS